MDREAHSDGGPSSDSAAGAVCRFTVTGKELRQGIRKLKPAFPRKGEVSQYAVVISTSPGKVTFTLVGAAVDVPAEANGAFTVELPLGELKMIMSDRFKDSDQLAFEFSPGRMTFRGFTLKLSAIRVVQGNVVASARSPSGAGSAIMDPAESPMGLPLLGVYAYVRKHGHHWAAGNRDFAEQQMQVETILTKAEKLLTPLGLSRADLEAVLDRRLGIGSNDAT